MQLYDRIYYTLYRMLIKIGQSENDMPRFNVIILMSLCTMLNAVAVISIFIAVTNRIIIVQSKIYMSIVAVIILCLNVYFIFYKKRYKKIEKNLSTSWRKEKRKNILITVVYVFFTAFILWLSLRYIRNNPITR
jgi:amino acid transporter